MQQNLDLAAPNMPDMSRDMANIEIGTSRIATTLGIVCFPFVWPFACWVLEPRTEALVLHYGILTEKHNSPGCHISNTCGREIRQISTAQISTDLPTQKITDSLGNPIIVSAVLAYRFTNPAAALLNVQNANIFVLTQASATLKQVVGQFTYDQLKHEASQISQRLCDVLQPKVNVAGAVIYSITLNELNYAPEIANAMLKKQAAQAMVDARQLIVKGSVDIAMGAIEILSSRGMVMDDRQKFDLVSGLLLVTASDKDVQPIMGV